MLGLRRKVDVRLTNDMQGASARVGSETCNTAQIPFVKYRFLLL